MNVMVSRSGIWFEAVETNRVLAVLPGVVLHHFLADVPEPLLLGDERDIPVHFAEHLDTLHHLTAVGLQAAIEVVECTPLTRRVVQLKSLVGKVLVMGS